MLHHSLCLTKSLGKSNSVELFLQIHTKKLQRLKKKTPLLMQGAEKAIIVNLVQIVIVDDFNFRVFG